MLALSSLGSGSALIPATHRAPAAAAGHPRAQRSAGHVPSPRLSGPRRPVAPPATAVSATEAMGWLVQGSLPRVGSLSTPGIRMGFVFFGLFPNVFICLCFEGNEVCSPYKYAPFSSNALLFLLKPYFWKLYKPEQERSCFEHQLSGTEPCLASC